MDSQVKQQFIPAEYTHSASSARYKVNAFKSLLIALVSREIKGHYRRAVLGVFWLILQPISYLVMFILIKELFAVPSDGMPRAVFLLTAMVPWMLFTMTFSRCGPSIYGNQRILRKTDVNHLVFPIAGTLSAIIEFMVIIVLFVAVLIYYQITPTMQILWLPLLLVLTLLFAFGLGLLLAAIGTYKRDLVLSTPFFLQVWLIITPIIYPYSMVPPAWKWIYDFNPMVGIIVSTRNVVLKDLPPDWSLLSGTLVTLIIVWLIAYPVFRYLSNWFADVL